MNNILKTIKEQNLIKSGEVIGVAVSGGSDSMSLLHFLNEHKVELDIDVCAIHVDHCLREESGEDADFVVNYCKKNGIRVYKFKIDVPKLMEQKQMTVEEAAREARYGVFESLMKKDVIDKIAIAHNMRDQAETIMLNLFRGAGMQGAKGMEYNRDGIYIRPMLNTSKKAIMDYIFLNDIPYVNDKTNQDNAFSRNYIRNCILPLIEERWPGVSEKLVNFSKDCAEDNEYINSQVFTDAVLFDGKTAQIPVSYFLYPNPLVTRIIFKTLKQIGVTKDIERVHIELIKDLALHGENGKKIKLPMHVTVFKEYDYITLTNKEKLKQELCVPFSTKSFYVENFGTISLKRTKDTTINKGELIIDASKIPEDAVWRFREYGDTFEKFGGGTKKLKDYLIDKKIPARIRECLPVLASGKNILAIAGIEISNSVRAALNDLPVTKIIVKLD